MTHFGEEAALMAGYSSLNGVALLSHATPMVAMPTAGRSAGSPASAEALRQQAAAVIQRSYRWLDATVPVAPQVTALIPVLITAVQQYEAEQYAASLNGAVSVVQTAQALHSTAPMLPVP